MKTLDAIVTVCCVAVSLYLFSLISPAAVLIGLGTAGFFTACAAVGFFGGKALYAALDGITRPVGELGSND
jgi:hypothetical protein